MQNTDTQTNKMYILEKRGKFRHGVFWVGTDILQGQRAADHAAQNDKDDYHEWCLCEFTEQASFYEDADHKIVYIGKHSTI